MLLIFQLSDPIEGVSFFPFSTVIYILVLSLSIRKLHFFEKNFNHEYNPKTLVKTLFLSSVELLHVQSDSRKATSMPITRILCGNAEVLSLESSQNGLFAGTFDTSRPVLWIEKVASLPPGTSRHHLQSVGAKKVVALRRR